jgi:uncharacterized protein
MSTFSIIFDRRASFFQFTKRFTKTFYHHQRKEGDDMKELVQAIAHELVDYPERVIIDELVGGKSYVLQLKVAKEDTGKVIGKHGRTAKAMRTILNAVSVRANKRIILEIIE